MTSNGITNVIFRFNPILLANEGENMVQRTVPHEVAHIVAEHVYGNLNKKIGHGSTWKAIMRMFGVTPSRCHDYDTSVIKSKHAHPEVKCMCGPAKLGPTQHKRMFVLKTVNYKCIECNTRYVLA